MTSTSDPIFSPDGEHMWTGTDWIPAHLDAPATRREPTHVDQTSGTLGSLSDGPGVIETVEMETEGDVLDVVAIPEVCAAAPRRPLYGFIFQAAGAIWRGHEESEKQTNATGPAYYRTTRGVFGSETHRVEDPTWWSIFMMLVTVALFLLSLTFYLIGGAVYLIEASARLVIGAVRKTRRHPDPLVAPVERELRNERRDHAHNSADLVAVEDTYSEALRTDPAFRDAGARLDSCPADTDSANPPPETPSQDRPVQFNSFTSGQELLRIRHEDSVVSAFNSQGTLLATGYENYIGLWDATTGAQIRRMRVGGWATGVDALVFSPDGTRLATTVSNGHTARIWDAATGTQILSMPVGDWTTTVEALAFSPDGNRLATGDSDHTARIWDATSGKELLRIRHGTGQIRAMAFSPDGNRVAIGGNDHTARIWDAITGNELLRFQHDKDGIRAVAFSPDGNRLATGGNDHTVRIWDARSV